LLVELVGIEPTTSPLRTARSPKLSYSPTRPIVASVSATREIPNKPRSFFCVEEMVDQVVAKLEIEIARVLPGVLRIRVVDHDVRALRRWIDIKMTAESVLPSGFSHETQASIGMHIKTSCHRVMGAGARCKISIGNDRHDWLPHLFQRGSLQDCVVFRLVCRIAEQKIQVLQHIRNRSVQAAIRACNSRIEIEWIFGELSVDKLIAVRPILQQRVRAAVEV